jgi:putative salt-induced outer membrane protein YdiY
MIRQCIFTAVITLAANSAFAQGTAGATAAAEEEGPWSGKFSLGYLSTSGNTDTTTYNTAFEVAYTKNKWIHTAGERIALPALLNSAPDPAVIVVALLTRRSMC